MKADLTLPPSSLLLCTSILFFVVSEVLGDRRRLPCTEGLLCAGAGLGIVAMLVI